MLQDTVERIFVGSKFVDVPKGMYLIRGENVVMLGEVVRSKPVGPGMLQRTMLLTTASRVIRRRRTWTQTRRHSLHPFIQSRSRQLKHNKSKRPRQSGLGSSEKQGS